MKNKKALPIIAFNAILLGSIAKITSYFFP